MPVGKLDATRSLVTAYGNTLTNWLITVISWPHGLATFSNSGNGFAFLMGNLYRDLCHEGGHDLGLAHGDTDLGGVFVVEGDPSTYMG